jgi:Protein of unknown function (DUF2726)
MPSFLITYWPFFVVLAMVLAGLALLRMYAGPGRLPYKSRGRIMTNAEAKFFRVLQKAVQDDFLIFAMVRIADLLVVDEGIHNRRGWIGRILSKHVDFVLCDPGTLEPKAAIELDDRSHERADRIERDEFVEHAFESARLPLVRIKVAGSYESRSLRQVIDDALANR